MPRDVPAWFGWPAYAILLASVVGFFGFMYDAWRHPKRRHESMFLALMLLWPIGGGCRVANIGPGFMQYWVADVGFPMGLSWLLWQVLLRRSYERKYKAVKTKVQLLMVLTQRIRQRTRLLFVAFMLSMAYEIVAGSMARYVNSQAPAGEKAIVGEFEWTDIAAYTLGLGIGWALLWRARVFIDSYQGWAAEKDAAAANEFARDAAAARAAAERNLRRPKGRKRGQR